jgi:hypothetical protein
LGDEDLDLGFSSSIEVSRHVISVSRDPVQAGVLVGEPGESGGEAKEIPSADMIMPNRDEIDKIGEKNNQEDKKETARTMYLVVFLKSIKTFFLEDTVCDKSRLAKPDIQIEMEGALQWSISNLTGLCTARLPNGRLLAMFWLDRRVSRGPFAAAFDRFLHVTAVSFENTQRNQQNERKMDLRVVCCE